MDNNHHTGKQLTDKLDGNWHKLLAALMHRTGQIDLVITSADLAALHAAEKNQIVVEADNERIRLRLVSNDDAAAIVIAHSAKNKPGDQS